MQGQPSQFNQPWKLEQLDEVLVKHSKLLPWSVWFPLRFESPSIKPNTLSWAKIDKARLRYVARVPFCGYPASEVITLRGHRPNFS